MSAEASRDALVERLFAAQIHALELFSVYLGVRLGLYDVLARADSLSESELAEQAGIAPRYAREWLEQQAVAGFVAVDGADEAPEQRRYHLHAAHAEVLSQPESPAYVAPFALMTGGIGGVLERLVDAYRTGAGVPYAEYGADFRDGQGGINRPAFTHELADWLAAVPDVAERLGAPGVRAAEIGSGQGWAAIALARAYPDLRVDGFDLDHASVADATRHAEQAGVGARVRFHAVDASALDAQGRYALVLMLEVLHDLARPVQALASARDLLGDGGALLVADERVADRFTAPGDEIERMMYGWSVVHCLPTQLVEQPSAALGTVLRADRVRELANEAGFARVDVLPIESDFFRFYRLSG